MVAVDETGEPVAVAEVIVDVEIDDADAGDAV